MNRERVMQLAAAAGFGANLRSTHAVKLERLVEAAIAEEREACAHEADVWQELTDRNAKETGTAGNKGGAYIAAAIRGRWRDA